MAAMKSGALVVIEDRFKNHDRLVHFYNPNRGYVETDYGSMREWFAHRDVSIHDHPKRTDMYLVQLNEDQLFEFKMTWL